MALVCDACGEPLISAAERMGYERRAVALILRDGRKVNPSVLRVARKSLRLKQTDLASFLDVSAPTISRWENGREDATRTTQLALAGLIDGVERGLLDLNESLAVARESHPPAPDALEVKPTDGGNEAA